MAAVKNLEEMTIEELIDKVEETELDLKESREESAAMQQRLEEAAEILAHHAYIHDTPYAKAEWIRKGTRREAFLV